MSTPSRPALFHSSPYNFDPRVTATERIRLPITITDVTLREGQQAAEVAFSPEDEVVFVKALAAAGVPVVQAGYAGADDETTRRLKQAVPEIAIAVLLVGWKDDAAEAMRSARDAGADVCSILFRAADAHLANLGHTHESALERVRELVALGRKAGFRDVVFGPSFSTLADFDFLMRLYSAALDAGATVISLADSMGTAKPSAVGFLVEHMRRLAGGAGVRVHMHNDFGLGVANTLAGIEAGADWVEVTVNGLGERAGNCPLEELVVALEALYGIRVGVRTEALFGLCKLVESLTRVPIPPMKPVAGSDVFSNKLEIHIEAAASDPTLMEPYDPVAVGNRRTIRLGRGTGPTGIRLKLEEMGLQLPTESIDRAVARVNELAIETKKGMSDEQFRAVVAELDDVSKETIDVRALFPEIDLIGDPSLRDAVVEIWEELWAMSEYERLEDVRVSLKIDYPQIKHCQGIVRGALALAPVWEGVHGVRFDRDVLLAAALLMDVSKLVETRPGRGGGNEQSELGRALPHAVYAAHLALQKGLPLSIVHVLTAHSPNGGKAPNTPEAHLLDWVDQADISAFGFDIWRRKVVHYQP